MAILIDGYNLLHVTGIFGKGTGPGGFQRAREALIRFLAASIDAAELSQTTIVFDANESPPGLPRTVTHEGMTVCYASDYPDADTMIEELIGEHDVPRSLLVVSSDHRIQRAARKRRARFVDSELWYSQQWQRRIERRHIQQLRVPEKPVGEMTAAEIDYWVDQFRDLDPDLMEQPKTPPGGSASSGASQSMDAPFPPGYGEDLLEGEDNSH